MSTQEEKDRLELGAKLRECREYLGFSQDDVSTVLGIQRAAVSLIESGQRKVDVMELKKLAELYQRPVSFFTAEKITAPSLPPQLHAFAKKAKDLSPKDLEELVRFAEFLTSRSQSKSRK